MHHNRKKLPHGVPYWINPSEELYFITVNCTPRGKNQLARPNIAEAIFETVRFRNTQQIWFVSLMLLMPDHLHALMSFPPHEQTIKKRIENWKRWLATNHQISWQVDFFENRLRCEESRADKANYIVNNPVRAGLAKRPEEWPFILLAQR